MRYEVQERQYAPQVLTTSEELLNSMSLQTTIKISENSNFISPVRCGYNTRNSGSLSARFFVLDVDGKPLTPCKASKIRILLKTNQAVPVWNKFSQMGIKMLVDTRRETPNTVLGVDNGTKFEGYSIIVDESNNLNVMWLLPDKSQLVRKMDERRVLRTARQFRNCRRRERRSDNREGIGFIAPSQKMMVDSRLKALREFFKYYPIKKVALEDVRFNHRDNKKGKNFSTIEIGKNTIKKFIVNKVGCENYILFRGHETEKIRKSLRLKKIKEKNKQLFSSHCVDSFSIASKISECKRPNISILVVDDTYRTIRRKLHDTQPAKKGIRKKYASGNIKGIRKGTMCNFGQICGGVKDKWIRIYDWNNKRMAKYSSDIHWLSHNFKAKNIEKISHRKLE